jgi:CRISPR/Cas system-associated exonuclease Cas4 (RecB family)
VSVARIALLTVALIAVTFAIAIPIVLARLRTRTGFESTDGVGASVIASDTGIAPELIVRDPVLGISGKPDYVIAMDVPGSRRFVPIEVKPTRRSTRLYDSDRLQLGAYLIGLRATAGEAAANFGYVRYASASFEVALTAGLQAEILEIVRTIRAGRLSPSVPRNHSSVARCRACAVRPNCNESLAD